MVIFLTYLILFLLIILIANNIFSDFRAEVSFSRFDRPYEVIQKKITPYTSLIALITSISIFFLVNDMLSNQFVEYINNIVVSLENGKHNKQVYFIIIIFFMGMLFSYQLMNGLGHFSELRNNKRVSILIQMSHGFMTFYLAIVFLSFFYTLDYLQNTESLLEKSVVRSIPLAFISGSGVYILTRSKVYQSISELLKKLNR